MMRIMNYYSPNNAHIADKIRFVANFKELHLGWTAFSAMSEGVEQFVDEHLPIIRLINYGKNDLNSSTQKQQPTSLFQIEQNPHWGRTMGVGNVFKHIAP